MYSGPLSVYWKEIIRYPQFIINQPSFPVFSISCCYSYRDQNKHLPKEQLPTLACPSQRIKLDSRSKWQNERKTEKKDMLSSASNQRYAYFLSWSVSSDTWMTNLCWIIDFSILRHGRVCQSIISFISKTSQAVQVGNLLSLHEALKFNSKLT